MTMLRPAILLFILLALTTGGLYPLVTTALGQWWFKDQANGSLIMQNGENRGSRLIGQSFTDARYFQGRPSATAESPYNPMASGGSNLAGSNPALMQQALSSVRNDYSLARLYAMGVDAWALANHFTQMRQVPGFELNGNTGDLTATQDCVINRKLSWLKYQQGQIVPAS